LILDEPTAGLDPMQIRETLALIQDLGNSHTILLSTHILSEVEAVCERVIIINAGRVGINRTLEELESQALTVLEVRGPIDQVTVALRGIDGVEQVGARAVEGDLSAFEVRTRDGRDLREAMAQAVMKRGWTLRRLDQQRRRLEDAFFDVLREQDPLKQPARAPAEAIQDLTPSGAR